LKGPSPNASPAQLSDAIRSEDEKRGFGAKDMTGIKLSDFVFSKVDNVGHSRRSMSFPNCTASYVEPGPAKATRIASFEKCQTGICQRLKT
jgi:hypothetical protein